MFFSLYFSGHDIIIKFYVEKVDIDRGKIFPILGVIEYMGSFSLRTRKENYVLISIHIINIRLQSVSLAQLSLFIKNKQKQISYHSTTLKDEYPRSQTCLSDDLM